MKKTEEYFNFQNELHDLDFKCMETDGATQKLGESSSCLPGYYVSSNQIFIQGTNKINICEGAKGR
jgi:hypothetical protein